MKKWICDHIKSTIAVFIFGTIPMSIGAAESCRILFQEIQIKKSVVTNIHGEKFFIIPVANNLKMAYRDERPSKWNGITYVLTPGLSESSAFFDSHAVALLKMGYRVVRLEPLNIGQSLLAQAGAPRLNLNLQADAMAQAQVIQSLNLKPNTAILYGHSRGAAISLIIENLMGPHFFKRIYISNSYVRWLANVYKQQANEQISAATKWMQLFNPFYYNPAMKGYIDNQSKIWSQIYANYGVDFAIGMTNFKDIVRKKIQNRSAQKATGLDLETEVEGVMAQYNAMIDSSILEYAQRAQKNGTDIRIGVGENDILVPKLIVDELNDALGTQVDTQFPGGHMSPIDQFDRFIKWITQE